MTIRPFVPAALVALYLATVPAFAQPAPESPAISMNEARSIAIDNGMVRIEEIELEDGLWELDGRDSDDGEIEIDISADDGRVVRIERDRQADALARP